MESPAELYSKGIRKKFKSYYATWLPNQKISMGDVGIIRRYTFEKVTNLSDIGINFNKSKNDNSVAIDYASGKDVSVSYESDSPADTLPGTNTTINAAIKFSKEGSFIISAKDGSEIEIDNHYSIGEKINALRKIGKWDPRWLVVTRIITFPYASIIISTSRISEIKFQIKNDKINNSFAWIGSENNFSIFSQTGDILKIIGEKEITPLFQVHGLKRRVIRNEFGLASKTVDPNNSDKECLELSSNDFVFSLVEGD